MTWIERMTVLFLISLTSFLSISSFKVFSPLEGKLVKEIIQSGQLKAMALRQKKILPFLCQTNVHSLSFNAHGNVNQGQTLQCKDGTTFIIHLGMGRIEERK